MNKFKIFLVFFVLLISISAVSAEGNFTSLQTDIVEDRSIYYEDMDVTSDSKIVTLSTRDRKLRDNRFLVVAVMTQVDGRNIDSN